MISNYPINRINSKFKQKWYEFVDIQSNKGSKSNALKSLDILNVFSDISSIKFELSNFNESSHYCHVLKSLIGFVYDEFNDSYQYKYCVLTVILKGFEYVTENVQLKKCETIKISTINKNATSEKLINYYRQHIKVNDERMQFYTGWYVRNNEGTEHWVNLINFYNNYEALFTKKIYRSLSKVAIKESKSTFSQKLVSFNSLQKSSIDCLEFLPKKFR